VGSNQEKKIDIRLICATNMPLYEMVQENTFRQDLLYRINTVEIRVPALREREEDVPLLISHFLQVYTRKYKKAPIRIEPSVLTKLKKYEWPGNIRELQHAVERAVILNDGKVISSTELFLNRVRMPSTYTGRTLSLEEVERKYLMELIEKNEGNISRVAKELGMTRPALYRRINKYGL
jgi:DNA-binding NtrC family response regulator